MRDQAQWKATQLAIVRLIQANLAPQYGRTFTFALVIGFPESAFLDLVVGSEQPDRPTETGNIIPILQAATTALMEPDGSADD